MRAKPVKCRALAFRLFREDEKTPYVKVQRTQYSCFDPLLTIAGEPIKFIGDDKPPIFKYLGRYLQSDLKEDLIKEQIGEKLKKWLKVVDDAPLEGRMKAWIVNFHVCSKLAWLLMVQDFPVSEAAKWQTEIHRRYRKWMGLAKSAESSVLYRTNENFGLKFKDLRQMLEQLRVVKWHILKSSRDIEVKKLHAYRLELDKKGHVGQGRSGSPCLSLEQLERHEVLEAMAVSGQHGRKG